MTRIIIFTVSFDPLKFSKSPSCSWYSFSLFCLPDFSNSVDNCDVTNSDHVTASWQRHSITELFLNQRRRFAASSSSFWQVITFFTLIFTGMRDVWHFGKMERIKVSLIQCFKWTDYRISGARYLRGSNDGIPLFREQQYITLFVN